MSHYRNLGGGRRDKNEPEIMARFQTHGWHPEQVSGNRQWDLNVYPAKPTMTGTNNPCFTLVCHVDVKGPKGKVEEAQREKWKALAEKGIPVYVVRTEADVDALVRGDLHPWAPWEDEVRGMGREAKTGSIRAPRPHGNVKRERKPACDCGYIVGRLKTNGGHSVACATRYAVRVTSSGYDPANPPRGDVDVRTQLPGKVRKEWRPPQSVPVDASKVAAETFAPLPLDLCDWGGCLARRAFGGRWCREHAP